MTDQSEAQIHWTFKFEFSAGTIEYLYDGKGAFDKFTEFAKGKDEYFGCTVGYGRSRFTYDLNEKYNLFNVVLHIYKDEGDKLTIYCDPGTLDGQKPIFIISEFPSIMLGEKFCLGEDNKHYSLDVVSRAVGFLNEAFGRDTDKPTTKSVAKR